MNTKLTLSLKKEVILQAKAYAKKHNVSLSFLIENYLLKITTELKPSEHQHTSIVDALSGIIKLENDFDYKAAAADYLTEKYK